MATTKYLNLEMLQYLLGKMRDRGMFGNMGFSTEDFTTTLKEKLDSLQTAADVTAISTRLKALEDLIEKDSDGAINKFNEIVTFLENVTDTQTLSGLLAAKANVSETYKKTEVDAALDKKVDKEGYVAYSTTEKNKLAALPAKADLSASLDTKVDKVTGKGLSTEDFTTDLKDKLDGLTAITEAEIDALIAASEASAASLLTEDGGNIQTENGGNLNLES